MGWIQLSSQDRPKRQGTVCPLGPKGKARTLGQYAPSVPKAKLGHHVHLVLEFCKLFWEGGGRGKKVHECKHLRTIHGL